MFWVLDTLFGKVQVDCIPAGVKTLNTSKLQSYFITSIVFSINNSKSLLLGDLKLVALVNCQRAVEHRSCIFKEGSDFQEVY